MSKDNKDEMKVNPPKVTPGGEKKGYQVKEKLAGLKNKESGKDGDIMKDLGKKAGPAKIKKEIDIDKFAEKKTQRTK